MTDRETYATPQIVLHWTIVALIIVQLLSADGMSEYFEPAKEAGTAPGFPGVSLALAHAASGATILVLVILRFALRLRYGAPPPPQDLRVPCTSSPASRITRCMPFLFSGRFPA